MTAGATRAASSFVGSANVVLLVVTIIASAFAIVSILGGLAVVFGGSWRKSEMEMLRQSRDDLTSVNMELKAEVATHAQVVAAKDQRIQELTYLATARQPFEQITTALEKHHREAKQVHGQILDTVRDIDSRLDARHE